MDTFLYRAISRLAVGLACLACSAHGYASIVVSDQSLADWGMSLNNWDQLVVPSGVSPNPNFYAPYTAGNNWGGNSSLSPTAAYNGFTFWYNYEDESDSAGDSGVLNPHAGGQNYDGEFLGVGISSAYLAVAIVTGQRPDNGSYRFSPGDLRIGTSAGTFGVEMTGKTYTLNSDGYTVSSSSSQPAGSVLKDTTWQAPPFNPPTKTQLTGGTLVDSLGPSQFYYADDLTYIHNTWYGPKVKASQHAFFELLIPLADFGDGTSITDVHWAPSCGNDLLDVNMDYTPPPPQHTVPEPAAMLVLFQAGLGIFVCRRRSRRTAAATELAA